MAEPDAARASGAANELSTRGEHDGAALDVSIILPVYNEVEHLKDEVDRIRTAMNASEYSYEIIVVDDGSSDGSGELAQTIPDIRVLRFVENRGSGSSRKAGTAAARGRVTVWTDVDMTYPNDQIPQLVKELEGYDQVVGARTTEKGTVKALRVPAKWFARTLASFLTSTKIPDLNSGFRAFRTSVARQYLRHLPTGFSCVTTMTMTFLAGGYSVKYVPIEYAKRAGRSKFHPINDTRRYIIQIVRMVLSYNPLRLFLPTGFLLLGIGVTKIVYDYVEYNFHVTTNTLLVLFAAFQVFAIGLLADLVVRATRDSDEVVPAAMVVRDTAP